ncbi:hypothetical protein OIDMADRAFT_57993 [Oidiodendron maius Zn]|uniref:Uncharacterized protein n=1 Tax=Oidiodendron maius (strain Zn) TaxID=913774 RepID=A0A0C3H1W1_OIDMZ|nr:hypothetical protein OIDMADRAFT_57993 [Oidiodendron maius Zn]
MAARGCYSHSPISSSLWVCGHDHSPWMTSLGISAKLLFSAVSYDLHGGISRLGDQSYDLDDLQELCGCLITFSTAEDESDTIERSESPSSTIGNSNSEMSLQESCNNDADLFVSLANYTVIEFLNSPLIFQTRVSCFALPGETIRSQFAMSVLRQALKSNLATRLTDWIHDREAYCLTLGRALYSHSFDANSELQDLFIQRFNPVSPHFCRFRAIQERIVISWEFYLLSMLPIHVRGDPKLVELHEYDVTLLNILLVCDCSLAKRLILDKNIDIQKVLSTQVTATFLQRKIKSNPAYVSTASLEGTILEIAEVQGFNGEFKIRSYLP